MEKLRNQPDDKDLPRHGDAQAPQTCVDVPRKSLPGLSVSFFELRLTLDSISQSIDPRAQR